MVRLCNLSPHNLIAASHRLLLSRLLTKRVMIFTTASACTQHYCNVSGAAAHSFKKGYQRSTIGFDLLVPR